MSPLATIPTNLHPLQSLKTMNKIKKEELSLSYRRSLARELAWKREIKLVRQGRGTRDWSMEEQIELLTTGRIRKYVAHHIRSVKEYSEFANHVDNIQFLTRKEHFKAHLFNWKQSLHLYFDHVRQSISLSPLTNGLSKIPVFELKDKYSEVLRHMNDLEQQYKEKIRTHKTGIETILKENENLSMEQLERVLYYRAYIKPEYAKALAWEARHTKSRHFLDACLEDKASEELIRYAYEKKLIYQHGGSRHIDMAWKDFAVIREKEDRSLAVQMEQTAARFAEQSKAREYYDSTAQLYHESANRWNTEVSRALMKEQSQSQAKEQNLKQERGIKRDNTQRR